jgi:hypothetical protein
MYKGIIVNGIRQEIIIVKIIMNFEVYWIYYLMIFTNWGP